MVPTSLSYLPQSQMTVDVRTPTLLSTRAAFLSFHAHERIKFTFFFFLPLRLTLLLCWFVIIFWKTGSTDSNSQRAAAENQPLWPAFTYLRFIFRPQLTGLSASCIAFNIRLLLFAPSWHRPRTICIYFAPHCFLMTCGCQRAWLCSCIWLPFLLHEKRSLSEASSRWLGRGKKKKKKHLRFLADRLIRTDCWLLLVMPAALLLRGSPLSGAIVFFPYLKVRMKQKLKDTISYNYADLNNVNNGLSKAAEPLFK